MSRRPKPHRTRGRASEPELSEPAEAPLFPEAEAEPDGPPSSEPEPPPAATPTPAADPPAGAPDGPPAEPAPAPSPADSPGEVTPPSPQPPSSAPMQAAAYPPEMARLLVVGSTIGAPPDNAAMGNAMTGAGAAAFPTVGLGSGVIPHGRGGGLASGAPSSGGGGGGGGGFADGLAGAPNASPPWPGLRATVPFPPPYNIAGSDPGYGVGPAAGTVFKTPEANAPPAGWQFSGAPNFFVEFDGSTQTPAPFDGWDLTGSGGWQIANQATAAQNVVIRNVKMKATAANGAGSLINLSQYINGLTLANLLLDANGQVSGAGCAVQLACLGAIVCRYLDMRNAPNDFIDITPPASDTAGSFSCRYSAFNLNGFQGGAHPDIIQYFGNTSNVTFDIQFNTVIQSEYYEGPSNVTAASYSPTTGDVTLTLAAPLPHMVSGSWLYVASLTGTGAFNDANSAGSGFPVFTTVAGTTPTSIVYGLPAGTGLTMTFNPNAGEAVLILGSQGITLADNYFFPVVGNGSVVSNNTFFFSGTPYAPAQSGGAAYAIGTDTGYVDGEMSWSGNYVQVSPGIPSGFAPFKVSATASPPAPYAGTVAINGNISMNTGLSIDADTLSAPLETQFGPGVDSELEPA